MKRLKIGNIDLEKDLSPFNGHLPYECRELSPKMDEIEFKLEHQTLRSHAPGEYVYFAEYEDEVYFAIVIQQEGHFIRYGKVPAHIVAQGEEAIRSHAELRLRTAAVPVYESAERWCRFKQNPDFAVKVKHGKVTLLGRIISADARYYQLRMEEPFVAEMTGGGYGWASAMGGRYMFDGSGDEPRFSADAIEGMKRDLVRLYDERIYAEKHAPTIGLVGRLNGRKNGGEP